MDSQGAGLDFLQRQEIFLHSIQTDYGAHPDFVQRVPGPFSQEYSSKA
jgi:hypothetical protein